MELEKQEFEDLFNHYATNISVSELETVMNYILMFDIYSLETYKSGKLQEFFKRSDKNDLIIFQKAVILAVIIKKWDSYFAGKFVPSIVELYRELLVRIKSYCESESGWLDFHDDIYWKDLAMARQIIFPAGAQIVESFSGFGIRQGVQDFRSAIPYLTFIAKLGGGKGFYQIHTHTPYLDEFNEKGWCKCFLRIAEMLKENQSIKGMFGGSWFYDPVIKDISPRLSYLQDIPLQNGARSFYAGLDKSNSAISKSLSRKKLFEEGKYIPKSYLLIWPRKEILSWAKRFRKQNEQD